MTGTDEVPLARGAVDKGALRGWARRRLALCRWLRGS
jgi:hypothetical protein